MGPVADEPELPTARAPDLRPHELLRPFDDDPGEVASRYARQGGERERASCVQHVAAVYGGGVDLDKDLAFRRLWSRDLRCRIRRSVRSGWPSFCETPPRVFRGSGSGTPPRVSSGITVHLDAW